MLRNIVKKSINNVMGKTIGTVFQQDIILKLKNC
jgi:hypothetical protein